eukprot:9479064-Pyramimonas_sp.AAC.1
MGTKLQHIPVAGHRDHLPVHARISLNIDTDDEVPSPWRAPDGAEYEEVKWDKDKLMAALRGSRERYDFVVAVESKLAELNLDNHAGDTPEELLKTLDTVMREAGKNIFERDDKPQADDDKQERLQLLAQRRELRLQLHDCDPEELEACNAALKAATQKCHKQRKMSYARKQEAL